MITILAAIAVGVLVLALVELRFRRQHRERMDRMKAEAKR